MIEVLQIDIIYRIQNEISILCSICSEVLEKNVLLAVGGNTV